MRSPIFVIGGLLAASVALAACQQTSPSTDDLAMPEIGYPESGDGIIAPPEGFDVEAFEAFIATGPTQEEFVAEYPDIDLILPMTPVTLEYRADYSRFFGEFDEDGQIIGGYFQ
jgi:hypothetical protein